MPCLSPGAYGGTTQAPDLTSQKDRQCRRFDSTSIQRVRVSGWMRARTCTLFAPRHVGSRAGWKSRCPDGGLDLSLPVQGELALSVDRLTSGNLLYDRELRRRIDAEVPDHHRKDHQLRRHRGGGRTWWAGTFPFTGTRGTSSTTWRSRSRGPRIELKGDYVFDIREFGMKPPSMLMLKVYPEVAVRVALYGDVQP